MNIFVLDTDPATCAAYHCDKHVIKMLIEYTQMLCSAINLTGGSAPYRTTHQNHPCSVWTRQSLSNWLWLHRLTIELHRQYTVRYGKHHKSGLVAETLSPPALPDIGLTPFAQAMPDDYRQADVVSAYRLYYSQDKAGFATWKTSIPDWFEAMTKETVR